MDLGLSDGDGNFACIGLTVGDVLKLPFAHTCVMSTIDSSRPTVNQSVLCVCAH